jgi:putative component of membrane protein insertase Oxa1/YidC/SpoIIIJ protein YidD
LITNLQVDSSYIHSECHFIPNCQNYAILISADNA